MVSGASSIRVSQRNQSLGVKYRDELFNIALLRIDPGFELSTIETIDKRLSLYRGRLRSAEKAFHNRMLIDPEEMPSQVKQVSESASLLSNPVHATVLGNFQLASFFTSVGFGLCNEFAPITHVSSQQYIVAGIPYPEEAVDWRPIYVNQDPAGFLPHYDYNKMLTAGEHAGRRERLVYKRPIIFITHIQLTGPISTISAGSLILPILYLIEEKAAAIGGNLKALLLDSCGWSDFVLLIRGDNIERVGKLVYDIAQITQQDLLNKWDGLISCLKEPFRQAQKDQKDAFSRRFDRMAGKLKVHLQDTSASDLQHAHLFSMTFTLPGVLWPFANDALQHEVFGESTSVSSRCAATFRKWKIGGKVRVHLRMNVRPGHEPMVWSLGDSLPNKKPKFVSVGHEDIILPHSSSSLCRGGEGRAILLKKALPKMLKLQWKLLGEPRVDFSGNDARTLLWKNPVCKSRYQPSPLLATTVDLEIPLPISSSSVPSPQYSIGDKYEQKISAAFLEEGTQSSIWALRKRLVSRQVLNSLIQVIALWREKLRDYSDANRMIELADSWMTWRNALTAQLKDEKVHSWEIEELIRSFTLPFGQAVVQRFITGFHMSEATDFTAEFKGGLSKLLTGLDGLVKSVLALVADSGHVGALTLTGHDSGASIELKTVCDRATAEEWTLAVANLNSTHLVHPLNIHTVIHEVLHTVPNSKGFQDILNRSTKGRELRRFFDMPESDSEEGLTRIRLEEIIVEYLVALLVFRNAGELYSHSYLLQVAIHPESYSCAPEVTELYLMENIARGFVIQQMLDNCNDPSSKLNWSDVEKRFASWWKRNQRFVTLDADFAGVCGPRMGEMIAQQPWEWQQRIEVIRTTVADYFHSSNSSNDVSGQLRASFYASLADSSSSVIDIKESLAAGLPVHVVFPPDPAEVSRPLRVRRLESLVAYLRLVRGYYEVLNDLLSEAPSSPLLLKRHDGNLDFRECIKKQKVLVNASAGALFTIGEKKHHESCRLRIAFLKSMWQHAEVTKNSEINHVLQEESLSLNFGKIPTKTEDKSEM